MKKYEKIFLEICVFEEEDDVVRTSFSNGNDFGDDIFSEA